jgi:hypothetical protein
MKKKITVKLDGINIGLAARKVTLMNMAILIGNG